MNNTFKSEISVIWRPLAATVFWGLSFIATKHLLSFVSPLVVIFLRQAIAVCVLSFLIARNKGSFTITKKGFTGILILALIAILHLFIQVTGMKYTTALNTGWIVGFSPVFMAILGIIFFKEKISLVQIVGVLISFTGLLVLISKGNLASIDFISNKGDFLELASAFTWAIYSFVNKKISFSTPPVLIVLYLFLFMSVLTAPFVVNADNFYRIAHLSLVSWIAVLFLGVFCSGLAYVFWSQALSKMSSSKVGVFLYIEPFVTLLGSWVLLNEQVSPFTVFGGIGIFAGVVLVNRK